MVAASEGRTDGEMGGETGFPYGGGHCAAMPPGGVLWDAAGAAAGAGGAGARGVEVGSGSLSAFGTGKRKARYPNAALRRVNPGNPNGTVLGEGERRGGVGGGADGGARVVGPLLHLPRRGQLVAAVGRVVFH